MDTATRQNIEIVQSTTSDEMVNRHKWRFFGSPTDA